MNSALTRTPGPARRRRLLHRGEHVSQLLLKLLHLPSQAGRVVRSLRPPIRRAPPPAVVPTHHPVRVHGVVHAVRVVRRHPVRSAGVAPVRRRVPGIPAPRPHRPGGVPAGRAPRPVGRVRTPRGLVRVVVRTPVVAHVPVPVPVSVPVPVPVVAVHALTHGLIHSLIGPRRVDAPPDAVVPEDAHGILSFPTPARELTLFLRGAVLRLRAYGRLQRAPVRLLSLG